MQVLQDWTFPHPRYASTHKGTFLGIEPTGRSITFDVIDVLKVQGDVITDQWGVMNIAKLMAQIS